MTDLRSVVQGAKPIPPEPQTFRSGWGREQSMAENAASRNVVHYFRKLEEPFLGVSGRPIELVALCGDLLLYRPPEYVDPIAAEQRNGKPLKSICEGCLEKRGSLA